MPFFTIRMSTNLLPPIEQKSVLHMYRKRFLALVFFSVAFLLLSGAVLLLPSYIVLRNNAEVLIIKRDQLQKEETSSIQGTLATTIADINKRLAVFPDVVMPSPVVGTFVAPVLKRKTGAVHITNLSYNTADGGGISLQISGTAASRSDLLAFADALKTEKGFKNVTVPISSFIKDSNVTFSITAMLDQQQK